jgi:Mrp family chromosome partitioning ATPase
MEKIQQALEKARQDRAQALGERAAPPAAPAGPAPAAPAGPIDGVRRLAARPGALYRRRIVASAGPSAAAESFRMLRTHVLNRLAALGGRAVAVTSPHQRDGKTFVAVNLAVALAQLTERSCVLVDADLRRPGVLRCLGLEVDAGLSEHLQGGRPLEDCLVRPGIEELIVLPQRRATARSSELLASAPMAAVADELKRRYPGRVIVYDCPPLLAADDPLVVQRLVDGVLVVIAEGSTTRQDLLRAVELVGEERYLGSILNNARWHALPSYDY